MRAPSILILGALLATGIASQASAQRQPAPSPPDTSLSDSLRGNASPTTAISGPSAATPQLHTVRVIGASGGREGYARFGTTAATKTPALLRDIPQAVTVISRALMRDQAMQSMTDVVRYVPGLTMGQGEGNRDQPTIRGNSTTADFFVDGVRDDAQYFRDLYNVERVEALKGSNAMIFGRGGGGGVINRVIKAAEWSPSGELTLSGGSYEHRRATLDVGRGFSSAVAARFNGVYENSNMFRDDVWLKRQGLNPTLSIASPSKRTRVDLGYENFIDYRTADRGIPSFGNDPLPTDISTFFGNPAVNFSRVRVNGGSASIAHTTSAGLRIHNQTRYTSYDKIYQNVLPGGVSADGADVTLSAYNNAHDRRNLFNQTDLTYVAHTGGVSHTLLAGAEAGGQVTDNFRNTGYFNDTATTFAAPVGSPSISTPVSFRQSASDADNRVTATTRSIYAQDQLELSEQLQMIAGVRYERFSLRVHDNRTNVSRSRSDGMVSPRVGLLLKPIATASVYASYSLSFLPGSGDQFSSLTDVTRALEPEKFVNVEAGAKWDLADAISLMAAAYRLDRTNTKAPAPDDPSLLVQTGSQRSTGFELGISGRLTPAWDVAGGFTRQRAHITSTTTSAPAGTTVPLVPATTLSLWNKYRINSVLGAGLGLVRQSGMYAAVSNTVVLPAFTRLDGGLYLSVTPSLRTQINVENILNRRYYPLANGNNNITPGAPRALRVFLTTAF